MSAPENRPRRPWHVIARVRAARLRRIEEGLMARFDELYATDRRGFDALLAVLSRVVTRQMGRGR